VTLVIVHDEKPDHELLLYVTSQPWTAFRELEHTVFKYRSVYMLMLDLDSVIYFSYAQKHLSSMPRCSLDAITVIGSSITDDTAAYTLDKDTNMDSI
jgi:hypothetical protein